MGASWLGATSVVLAQALLHGSASAFAPPVGLAAQSLFAPAARHQIALLHLRPGRATRQVPPGQRPAGGAEAWGRGLLRMSLQDVDSSRLFETVSAMEPSFLPAETILGATVAASENSTVLPLFPLGSVVYTPFSEHRLNIFEPRYRAMYNDILFSGSRRFAVCTMHPEDGRFSEYATVFYLKDLKEVSEQTNDAVKFVCDHEVMRGGCDTLPGREPSKCTRLASPDAAHANTPCQVIARVKINKVLNPSAWASRETYLKIEVDYQEDTAEVTSISVQISVFLCAVTLAPSPPRSFAPSIAPFILHRGSQHVKEEADEKAACLVRIFSVLSPPSWPSVVT
jgi:hypothetical protein